MTTSLETLKPSADSIYLFNYLTLDGYNDDIVRLYVVFMPEERRVLAAHPGGFVTAFRDCKTEQEARDAFLFTREVK